MSTARQTGLDIFRTMMPKLVAGGDDAEVRDSRFADELGKIRLEELVYHASGYVGYPAASSAGRLVRGVFDDLSDDEK
ncbi:hypothetical protein CRI77_11295 [Mycolicibacterium duvalii]|uniref:Uncharacterized protein n=1 Tax=Mycolicibacterium duvalii TaxID=39688 RepID=A0A7I7JZD5_9MYCO|nr:hypothetical protein [Mycolicibacterium duvalii]MCV7370870.1 hypothetical protein [Mycolicibacterium duvalii]PEG41313.1 hypothetical protein CRI77_11295 [Mycolicibacterium duvalii]BBX17123.1 hypothetical protein MDUV_19830 [Mycolicibacterium duvalii]